MDIMEYVKFCLHASPFNADWDNLLSKLMAYESNIWKLMYFTPFFAILFAVWMGVNGEKWESERSRINGCANGARIHFNQSHLSM